MEMLRGTGVRKGHVRICISGDGRRAEATMASKGAAKSIAFSLSNATSGAQGSIVAVLERDDGWLLARGSAPI